MTHAPPMVGPSDRFAVALTALAHRALCVAIFAVAGATIVVALARPERPALGLAFGICWLAVAVSVILWSWPRGEHHRREGRRLTIVAAILLLIILLQMSSIRVRHRLLWWGTEIMAYIQTQHSDA